MVCSRKTVSQRRTPKINITKRILFTIEIESILRFSINLIGEECCCWVSVVLWGGGTVGVVGMGAAWDGGC